MIAGAQGLAEPFEASVAAAVDALAPRAAGAFAWFGDVVTVGDWSTAPETARLVGPVTTALYAHFYTQGRALPMARRHATIPGMRTGDLTAALADANMGQGSSQGRWRVVGARGRRLTVRRADVTISVAKSAFTPDGHRGGALAADGSIRLPKGLANRSPGHYIALGDRGGCDPDSEDCARIYWHLTPLGAPAIMRRLTSRLNRLGMPFVFKVVNDTSGYGRCDTGVLYVARTDEDEAVREAVAVAARGSGALLPQAPALTLPLAHGLAYAEDPGSGESFGLDRCRLIATAVVASWIDDDPAPMERVTRAFTAAGTSLAAPYRSGSSVRPGHGGTRHE